MKFVKTDDALAFEQQHNYSIQTLVDQLDFTPKRATDGSAGYDLRACILEPITIFPDKVVKIPTGIKIWIGNSYPTNAAGFLFPRSSTSGAILNNTIGVIDSDYQGEIFVKLRNITPEIITIQPGETFAQLVFMPVYLPTLEEVNGFEEITKRGEGGFGSTNTIENDLLGR
jgi:dUTP pyrophosphatase